MAKRNFKKWQLMLTRMWCKGNTYPFLVGAKPCAATVEISLVVPQENGNKSISRSSYTIFRDRPKGLFILAPCTLLFYL